MLKKILLTLLISTGSLAFAKYHSLPPQSGQILNYTDLNLADLFLQIDLTCRNGWGDNWKAGQLQVEINSDGSFDVPQIQANCFSIWGSDFYPYFKIVNKQTQKSLFKDSYQSQHIQTVYLVQIQAKSFTLPAFDGDLTHAKASITIDAKASTPGLPSANISYFHALKGTVKDNVIYFDKTYLAYPTYIPQSDMKLTYEFLIWDSQSHTPLYGRKKYNLPFPQSVIELPFDSLLSQ